MGCRSIRQCVELWHAKGMNAIKEKSDFIGGVHWHAPLPDPVISECAALIDDAQSGDKDAIRRCAQLYKKRTKAKRVKR